MAPAVLLDMAATGPIVWVGSPDGDPGLADGIAAELAVRAAPGRSLPVVEVMTGSYDLPGARLLDLVAVMDRLRSPGGCPWDREQTHRSLATYLLEETYETLEAIEADPAHLREELGDLLLQIVFHARIAEEEPAGGVVHRRCRRRHRREADPPASARLRRRGSQHGRARRGAMGRAQADRKAAHVRPRRHTGDPACARTGRQGDGTGRPGRRRARARARSVGLRRRRAARHRRTSTLRGRRSRAGIARRSPPIRRAGARPRSRAV